MFLGIGGDIVRGQQAAAVISEAAKPTVSTSPGDCAERYPLIFGAEIHTLGRSAPECFPDPDPVMVCLRGTSPMFVCLITANVSPRHPCKQVKSGRDIYDSVREARYLRTDQPSSNLEPYLDTRRPRYSVGLAKSFVGQLLGNDKDRTWGSTSPNRTSSVLCVSSLSQVRDR